MTALDLHRLGTRGSITAPPRRRPRGPAILVAMLGWVALGGAIAIAWAVLA